MAYYFYILYSPSSKKYYLGTSGDPWSRLRAHNNSERNTYTSKYRPWQAMAFFEAGATRSEAMATEKWVKKQKSRSLIEKLIDPAHELGGRLARLVRVPLV